MSELVTRAGEYYPIIKNAADTHGVPVTLLLAQALQESAFNPQAVSPVGAQGLFQFMPATARGFGINPFDPTESANAAAEYDKQLYDQFGSWAFALAAYNWGPGNLDAHIRDHGRTLTGLPQETSTYVSNITRLSGVA